MRARSLLLYAPHRLGWSEVELPVPGPDEVSIRTQAGAVSIGSELPLYRGTARQNTPVTYPRMTGYESLGTIVARGSSVRRLSLGDRVVAFYGHRTAAVVPASKAIAVPEGVPETLALLAILSCDAAKGVHRVLPWLDEPVLITGFGVMGALTLFMLRALGSSSVDVVEPDAVRRRVALRLGARSALASGDRFAGGDRPYMVGFECSSHDAAFALLQERLGAGGRICVLADGNREPLTIAPAFHEKELAIVGSSDGWDYQAHAGWFFDRISRAPSGLEALFQYETGADGLIHTFEQLAAGEIAPMKIFVQYSENVGESG